MSLDLTKVASQVGGLLARLKESLSDRQEHLKFAFTTAAAQSENLDSLKRKLSASRTSWLLAGLHDGINLRFPLPSIPANFTVMATDGSHIDVDRHQAARCYLINIGSVLLKYGDEPDAVLENLPSLYASEEDLVITEPGTNREQPVEGALLGLKRDVDEVCRLTELAEAWPAGSQVLALVDGTLIKWGFSTEGYRDYVTEQFLDKGFLACLDRMKKLNADRQVALASYISMPRSNDVINALKVAVCPNDPLDTDKHCLQCLTRECEKLNAIRDRDFFAALLENGERSCLFTTSSEIVKQKYNDHYVYFFYLNVDEEIARVEVPKWVADNEDLLNLAHGLIVDQCRRGQGYPVALSEAHEQAVVTGADRDNFWHLVEMSLEDEKISTAISAKSRSKNTRWV